MPAFGKQMKTITDPSVRERTGHSVRRVCVIFPVNDAERALDTIEKAQQLSGFPYFRRLGENAGIHFTVQCDSISRQCGFPVGIGFFAKRSKLFQQPVFGCGIFLFQFCKQSMICLLYTSPQSVLHRD